MALRRASQKGRKRESQKAGCRWCSQRRPLLPNPAIRLPRAPEGLRRTKPFKFKLARQERGPSDPRTRAETNRNPRENRPSAGRDAQPRIASSEPRQAVIAGDPQKQETRFLAYSVLRDFHPDLVVLYSKDAGVLSGDAARALAAVRPIQGMPALYLCENFTCRAPVTSHEDARRLISQSPRWPLPSN